MPFFKYLIFFVLFVTSCKKESETSLDYSEINSTTNFDLRCIYQHNANEIYIGGGDDSHGVVLLSSDNGLSFQYFNQSFNARVNSICFQNSQVMYVVCNNFLLLKSGDQGITWNKIEVSTPVPYQYQTNLFDIKFINDSVGFFCGGEEYAHGIIGRTINGGQTWTYNYFDHELRSIEFKDAIHGYCGGYGAMLFTDDGGESWQLTKSNDEFITAINYTSLNGIACGYQGSVLKNNNTLNWEITEKGNNSISSRRHYNTVCSNDNKNYFVFGNDGKCALSTDAGNNWQLANAFDGHTVFDALSLSPTSGIAVGESGKVFRFNK